jgi:hypothetical protein
MSTGAWSIEIDHDHFAHVEFGAMFLPSIVNFMSTGAWSID